MTSQKNIILLKNKKIDTRAQSRMFKGREEANIQEHLYFIH